MSPRRLLGGALAAGLGALFFGDLLLPGAALPAGSAPRPLAEIIPLLPARNVGRHGAPGDPFTLLFVGGEAEVSGALEAAGWTPIPVGLSAPLRAAAVSLVRRGRAPNFPPMNGYMLEGRPQTQNWSKPITPIARRHHFRLWKTAYVDEAGRPVWWGSGNLDVAVRLWDLSHTPDPDSAAERDFIGGTLRGSRWVESLGLVDAPQVPGEGANDKGYPFRTDRRVLVARLKTPSS